MSDWLTLINLASRDGYRVRFDEEAEGWIVIAPKAFRRPEQEHGSFKDESAAWRGAAFLASKDRTH
jgi:hypothetical protein